MNTNTRAIGILAAVAACFGCSKGGVAKTLRALASASPIATPSASASAAAPAPKKEPVARLATPPRWLNPRPDGETFFGLSFLPTGELVGDIVSDLRYSEDGGKTWGARAEPVSGTQLFVSPTGELLRKTRDGVIHRSSDGGRTWHEQVTDPKADAVWASGELMVAGDRHGALSYSVDGGKTWQASQGRVRHIKVDRLMGTATCLFALCDKSPTFLVSTDAGKTFHELLLPTDWTPSEEHQRRSLGQPVGAFHLPDGRIVLVTRSHVFTAARLDQPLVFDPEALQDLGSIGTAVSTQAGEVVLGGPAGRVVMRTARGAYREVTSGDPRSFIASASRGDEVALAGTNGLFAKLVAGRVAYASPRPVTIADLHGVWGLGKRIFAVGAKGAIVRSDDGGETWAAQDSGASDDLLAVHGRSADDLAAVGKHGLIVSTHDGGASWKTEYTPTEEDLHGVWLGADFGIAVGAHGTALARQVDGLWERATTGSTGHLTGVWARSERDVYVSSWDGILRSRDGGRSYAPALTSKAWWYDVTGADGIVVAAGNDSGHYHGSLAVSHDGEHFSEIATPSKLQFETVVLAPSGIEAWGAQYVRTRDERAFDYRVLGNHMDIAHAWHSPDGYVVLVGKGGAIARLDDDAPR